MVIKLSDENGTQGDKKLHYLGLIIAIVAIVVTIILAIWQYSLSPPDFSISINPMQGTVHQGAAITTDLTIKGVHGYEEMVCLSATGHPSGVILAFAPQSAEAKPSYTSRVTINVNSNVLVDDYTIGIKGTGADGKEHRCSYTLTVKPSVTPTSTPTPTPTPTPAPHVTYQVLFDETRLQEKGDGTYYNQISGAAACGGSNFSKLLEDNDFHVSSISTKPIEYKELEKYDVLILFSSGDYSNVEDYSEDEIDAIEKFVKEGGGLFLTRESWRGAGEHGTGEIAKRFGVSFAKDGQICDPRDYYKLELKNVVEIFVDDNSDASLNTTQHAITKDLYSFYLVKGTYIRDTGYSNVLAYADSDAWFDNLWDEQEDGTRVKKKQDADEKTGPFPVLSVMDYGEGRVVFMGDKGLFMNCWLDKLQNKDLGWNIVKWLVKLL